MTDNSPERMSVEDARRQLKDYRAAIARGEDRAGYMAHQVARLEIAIDDYDNNSNHR